MQDSTLSTALDLLSTTPRQLQAVVAPLPDWVLERPADDGWSPKDVIAHLLISQERGAFSRIKQIMEEDQPLLLNLDEQEQLDRSGYRAWAPQTLLSEFQTKRLADMEWLRTIDGESRARLGNHSAVGPVSAEELVFHAANHDCLHLQQLIGMVRSHFEPRRGAMRAF